MKAFLRYLPGLLLALSLGACQFREAAEPVVETPTVESPAVVVQPEESEEIAILAPLEPEITPPPPPPISVPAPDTLLGLNMERLEGLFGTPTFVRRDPPAELWQYHSSSCVLDLFLYEESVGSYQVNYVEFRETGLSLHEKENCLRDIILHMDNSSG